MMKTTPQRRYVEFEFSGYAPIDLAVQMHLIGKKTKINIVGEEMEPYTEYLKQYGVLKAVEQKSES